MLTSVRVYRPNNDFVEFSFNSNANDFFIKDISGLGVDKSIVLEDSLTVPGGFYQNSRTNSRNIVMRLGYSNSIESVSTRRREIMAYFVPGSKVRLQFETDELPTVQIYGVVETADAPVFSRDPDISISILCSNPYFEKTVDTVSPLVVTANGVFNFDYEGTIPAGIKYDASRGAITGIADLHVRRQGVVRGLYWRDPAADSARTILFSSVFGDRYAKIGSASYLKNLIESNNPEWPQLRPGANSIEISMTTGIFTVSNFRWRARYEGL